MIEEEDELPVNQSIIGNKEATELTQQEKMRLAV